MTTKVPALKNIPPKVDRELADTLNAMKEAQEIRLGRLGDPLDRAITLRELIDSGMAKQLTNKPFNPNGTTPEFIPNDDAIGDLTIPPAPTGLEASGAFTEIIINWNTAPYTNHAYTEVWRSRDDEVGTATLITTTSAFVTTDPVGYDQTYFYWVRFVSTSNVRGPFNQTNGTKAVTVQNVAEVLTQLTETLADLPGYSTLTGLIDDGTLVIRASSAPSTRTDGSSLKIDDIWLDTDDDQLYVRNSSNNAWVKARDGTIKADIDTLIASLNSSNSRSDSTISAAIAAERVVRVTAEGANTTSINNLTSTVNGVSSSVTTVQNAVTNGTSSQAGYGISVNADGAIAGMYIMADTSNNLQNNTSSTNIIFEADQFAIRSSSASTVNADGGSGNKYTPFIVRTTAGTVNGLAVPAGVYIKDGWIQEGSITNAKIADATIESAKIVSLVANKITAGTMSADRISGGVIQSTDLSTGGSSTINGDNITTGTVSANRIDTAILRATDVGSGGSTTIDGGRITTGTISATRIDTANLTLPSSGAAEQTIGPWTPSNTMQYKYVTSVGSGAGFYHGFVRLQGVTNHIKTVSLVYFDSSTSAIIYNSGTTDKLPGQVDRFFSSSDSANIPQAFVYTGSNTVNLFILAQADSAPDTLKVTARFYKYST